MKLLSQSFIKVALVATALISTSALAQKIAVVDVQGVLQALPQTQAVVQSINEEFQPKLAELDKLRSDGQFEAEKLRRDGPTMSDAQKTESQEKIMAIQTELQQRANPLQQQIQARQQQEQTKLLGLVKQAIDAIAAAEGYDMVLQAGSAVYAKPEFDISQKVIDRVSKAN